MKKQRSSHSCYHHCLLLLLCWVCLISRASVALAAVASSTDKEATPSSDQNEEHVEISAECSALLLVGGSVVGGVVVPFLSMELLTWLGFTSTGVMAGSWAAMWQSSIPLAAEGSLFSILQSAAMKGAGKQTTFWLQGAVLSAGVTSQYLQTLCGAVDVAVKEDKEGGRLLALNLQAVQCVEEVVGNAKEWAAAYKQKLSNDEHVALLVKKADELKDSTVAYAQKVASDERVQKAAAVTREKAAQVRQHASQAWNSSLSKAREKRQEWRKNDHE